MDFHSLSRRELQTLCKKNKIPANQTNVAMADALTSLEMVEGIDEILNPSQSESTQSSIASYDMSDLTSPYVPATGGRSTRRRNTAKEEIGSVIPTTRTRRTAQKNLGKDSNESQADSIGTPAMVAQSNRNKGKMASVCRKMDSQLKECAEEDNKEANLMTPAPIGAASRRRNVVETEVKHAYSTRRSVRLAAKTVEKLNEVENEDSESLKKELLTNDGENEEVKSKEALEEVNEPSGITGVDDITIKEESSVNEDKSEVVSAEETVLPLNLSNEVQQNDGVFVDAVTVMEENSMDEDKSEFVSAEDTILPLNLSNEVQQNDGVFVDAITIMEENSVNEYKPEFVSAEDTVLPMNLSSEVLQNDVESTEELITEKDALSQDDAADFDENVTLESKDNLTMDDFSSYTDCHDEIEIEEEVYHDNNMDTGDDQDFDSTLVKFTELNLQKATKEVSPGKMLDDAAAAEADSDFVDLLANPVELNKGKPDEIEVPQTEESEKAAESAIEAQLKEDEPEEIEVPQLEEIEKAAESAVEAQLNEDEPNKVEVPQLEAIEKSADAQGDAQEYTGVEGAADVVHLANLNMNADISEKTSVTMKMVTGFTDNKENIGSDGNKLIIMQDRAKENEDKLAELSVRQLTKMLKQKLQITNKSSKNEDGKEVISRTALQALPENQLLDGTKI